MEEQKMPLKVKPNKNQVRDKIDTDFKRQWIYIIPREGTFEFILNKNHDLDLNLFHIRPWVTVDANGRFLESGKPGHLNWYYLPISKHKAILRLFKEFDIPEKLHQKLIWIFLAMFFDSCKSSHASNFFADLNWKRMECSDSIDLLEEFAQNKLLMKGFTFEYKERLDGTHPNGASKFGPLKYKKFRGHIAAQFLQKILKNYKIAEDYSIHKSNSDNLKKNGTTDIFFGHKNMEKLNQTRYSLTIFDFLRQHLFHSAWVLFKNEDEVKYNDEIKRLKKLYSRRKMFLFIGKLMILSGLLKMKVSTDDDIIIGTIHKKLQAKLKEKKEYLEEVRKKNQKSEDGSIEAIPFYEQF